MIVKEHNHDIEPTDDIRIVPLEDDEELLIELIVRAQHLMDP